MLYGAASSMPAVPGHARVTTVDDLDHLVKIAEVYSGHRGRRLVVRSGDHLHYRVHLRQTGGYEIERLSEGGKPLATSYVTKETLRDHCLGAAMQTGVLFTSVD